MNGTRLIPTDTIVLILKVIDINTNILYSPITQTYTCEYLLFVLSSVGTTSFQDQVLSSPESFTAPIISRSPLMLCWTVCLIKY